MALVCVDHCSKWMMAVPVRNKSAATIAKALKYQILPNLIKLPTSILSDNGMEFRGEPTESVLEEFGINHLYTSPYTPSSNGAVERLNRTLLGLIKALVSDMADWDRVLARAIILYNNTFHSQINMSPSDYLMKKSHTNQEVLPIDRNDSEMWKEGHPNFKSFDVNQKVLKEIKRMGDRVSYKLMPKFEGPFLVKKVQSNGLSYEISRPEEPDRIIKCHHRKLRAYNELPNSLRKFITEEVEGVDEEEECRREERDMSVNQEKEYNDIAWSDSDSQSSFRGFSLLSATESEDSECNTDDKILKSRRKKYLRKEKKCQKVTTRENSSHSQEENIASEDKAVSLQAFQCSEEIIKEGYKSSTPENGNTVKLFEHMNDNIIEFSLSTIDKTISEHEEVLRVVDMEQKTLSELSAQMNDAFMETKNLEEHSICNYSGFQESNSFQGQIDGRIAELKRIVAEGRNSIAESRDRSKCLRRELWEWRKTRSFNTTADDSTLAQLECEEHLADRMTSTPKREPPGEKSCKNKQLTNPYWLRSRNN